MSRHRRLYLSLTLVTVLGLALGTAWSLSDWHVNLLHLVIGSVILGFALGSVLAAAFRVGR